MIGLSQRGQAAMLGVALAVGCFGGGVHQTTVRASAGATPTPISTAEARPPSACTTAAPSIDDLNAVIEAAAPTADLGEGPGRGEPVPEGEPAPPETERAVRAIIREYVACQNAGELLRAYALYSDGYLNRLFARQGAWDQAAYLGLATPRPNPPDERSTIVEVAGVRLLPDGRAGATVTIAYQSIPMPKRFFFTFVDEGDRWAIDDILGEISFSVP